MRCSVQFRAEERREEIEALEEEFGEEFLRSVVLPKFRGGEIGETSMQERSFALLSGYCRRSRTKKTDGSRSSISPLMLFFILVIGVFAFSRWMTASTISSAATIGLSNSPSWPPLICSKDHSTCPSAPSLVSRTAPSDPENQKPPSSCPAYFRWIHEDLQPWKSSGITEEMVERAKKTASFRLVIIRGRIYVERYRKSYQTRDVFTIWGIIQLLRRYPGRIPDLDLMFDCVDWPIVSKIKYSPRKNVAAPPLFRYCGDDSTLDIVFPDWSFWGWPEINIKPWDPLLKEIMKENKKIKWMDRDPHAYWKGNPEVAETRKDLLRCNKSADHDYNARIYAQDWFGESQLGFEHSNLAHQCLHRYKIYIEGSAWSVSEKYILACDSPTLLVKPRYYDFFSRGLFPVHHYWPIRDDDKCPSIEFAVQWGNSHKQKAQEIGREGSRFIAEQLSMDHVYDYMFHLLKEYANLLRFQPTKPKLAQEYCVESMACNSSAHEKPSWSTPWSTLLPKPGPALYLLLLTPESSTNWPDGKPILFIRSRSGRPSPDPTAEMASRL